MLIIGEMNLTFKRGSGEFFCPHCAAIRNYALKRTRRFLTVYFIPLIPLHLVSEHVQCQNCRKTFPADALKMRQDDYERLQLTEFANDVRRIMVLTMLADDQAEPAEINVLRQVYRRIAQLELDDAEIQRDIALARRARVDAATYCRAIASRRSNEEKDWIVRGAFLIATAAGDISPERLEQLKLIPGALDVPEARFRQIVENASA